MAADYNQGFLQLQTLNKIIPGDSQLWQLGAPPTGPSIEHGERGAGLEGKGFAEAAGRSL
jgi:hypothetical protein